MRIAAVANPGGINSSYRVYEPMGALLRRGHEVHGNRAGEPVFQPARLLAADVVQIHRYVNREAQAVVTRLRDAGVGVVWDNDDDLTNVPRGNPNHAALGGVNRRMLVKLVAEMVRAVDVVTTPSAHMAEQFDAAGARDVRVIENYLPVAFPGAAGVRHDGIVVVWLAALEHQIDYEGLRLRPVLERLLDRHADLRIVSIGLGLGLRHDRYEHVKRVEFPALPRALAAADVGIAPLVDVAWNRARSNVKLKEYAAAGLPWLASPVGAYRGMGEQQGGRLVADDAWEAALDALIADRRARRKLAKRAAKWAKGQTIAAHVGAWEAALSDAAERGRARRAAPAAR